MTHLRLFVKLLILLFFIFKTLLRIRALYEIYLLYSIIYTIGVQIHG